MSRFGVILVVGICLVSQTWGQEYQQKITLYANPGGQGQALLVYEPYVAQLGVVNFDGRARSACLTGMWLVYDLPFYNSAGNGPMQYHFGANNYCVDLKELQGKVSSVRSAGNFIDYRAETVTLYENTYMQGIQEFIYGDIRSINLDQRVASLIVTAGSWTLYDGPNFYDRGNSVCVTPKNSNPAVITDTTSIRLNKSIRSVRKGCANNIRRISI